MQLATGLVTIRGNWQLQQLPVFYQSRNWTLKHYTLFGSKTTLQQGHLKVKLWYSYII